MAKPYSLDLREQAMAWLAAGESSSVVAAALSVAVSSVIKWAARERQFGSVAPGRMGGHRPFAISGKHRFFVLQQIEKTPHVTLQALSEALAAHGLKVLQRQWGASWRASAKALKKTVLTAEQIRPDIARRRRRWIHYRGRIDPHRLVFIDETWIKTNMAPLRGWGTRGERLITHVPHGHWQTMTFIGALRHDRIEAPWVLNGPINAGAFKTYVRAELIKTLKPDGIVVLDNLNSHKGKAVRAMVRSIGARLVFLPSYSPDLNPIEQAFAKIKHTMRKAMRRSVAAVECAVADTLDTITPQECANYLANAGYKST